MSPLHLPLGLEVNDKIASKAWGEAMFFYLCFNNIFHQE